MLHSGFCYDQSCDDLPIQDDTRLSDYNVDDLVNLFVNRCSAAFSCCAPLAVIAHIRIVAITRSLTDASYSATNNVMFLMG